MHGCYLRYDYNNHHLITQILVRPRISRGFFSTNVRLSLKILDWGYHFLKLAYFTCKCLSVMIGTTISHHSLLDHLCWIGLENRPMPRTTVGALEQDFTLCSGSSFSPVGLHASPGRALLLFPLVPALVTTIRCMGSYPSPFVAHDHSAAIASSSLERWPDTIKQNKLHNKFCSKHNTNGIKWYSLDHL